MVSTAIKEATKSAHQQLEKTVVMRLKGIRSQADYADVLKHFYAYFSAVEQAIAPFITSGVLPDYASRRNASHIRQDIVDLGENVDTLPAAKAPNIQSVAEAFGALYVLEGSIMGGPYIVQMLKKYGMETGFSFFSGYGESTGQRWAAFTERMNELVVEPADVAALMKTGEETFARFEDVFAGSTKEQASLSV
ncbi:biliverdin-producing heme oxygenase [Sphingobacterium corticis]|uniref:Biliverdin-producing heme oxygenase n=1 Tax=Sphingobacterium corticis TaxID=1812823 RepID=A0ABW5NK15_9SPHI